jgi:magnesium chelatase subunit I
VKASVLQVFKQRVTSEKIRDVLAAFDEGVVAHAGEDVSSSDYVGLFANVPALRDLVGLLVSADASQATQASAVEFVLEGLHLSKRLNKDSSGARSTYRSRT